ncbi:hypothetical protein CRYUN_Cryun03dG0082300 [Craigia yunnanensis]
MGNLSKRVSKSALWEVFLEYGKVVDIYIPHHRNDTTKKVTFVFVRYKLESEMVKVIEFENNKKVDGRFIRVNKASFGWEDRRNRALQWRKKLVVLSSIEKSYLAFRDNRSYKEVLKGSGLNADGSSKLLGIKGDSNINVEVAVEVEVPSPTPKKVNYDLDIPKAELEWLDRIAIGYIKMGCSMNQTIIYMVTSCFRCQANPMDRLSILLTFNSKNEMSKMIKDDSIKGWFEDVVPWCMSLMLREIAVWVILEEVLLQVWHKNFFESLGNSWGAFICLDDCISKRLRFDSAMMLDLVKSSLSISSVVSINVRGLMHKILVTMEDFEISVKQSPIILEDLSSDGEEDPSGNNHRRAAEYPVA